MITFHVENITTLPHSVFLQHHEHNSQRGRIIPSQINAYTHLIRMEGHEVAMINDLRRKSWSRRMWYTKIHPLCVCIQCVICYLLFGKNWIKKGKRTTMIAHQSCRAVNNLKWKKKLAKLYLIGNINRMETNNFSLFTPPPCSPLRFPIFYLNVLLLGQVSQWKIDNEFHFF